MEHENIFTNSNSKSNSNSNSNSLNNFTQDSPKTPPQSSSGIPKRVVCTNSSLKFPKIIFKSHFQSNFDNRGWDTKLGWVTTGRRKNEIFTFFRFFNLLQMWGQMRRILEILVSLEREFPTLLDKGHTRSKALKIGGEFAKILFHDFHLCSPPPQHGTKNLPKSPKSTFLFTQVFVSRERLLSG